MPRGMLREEGRHGPHHPRDLWPWEAPGQKLLDLRLPPVRRRLEQLVRVFRREMRRQETHPGQMEPPLSQGGEEGREPPGGSGCLDPLQGTVLGEPKLVDTIRVHRRVAGRGVEPASIDLGDVGEERGRGHAILGDQRGQIAKEGRIAEMEQRVVAHQSTCSRGGSDPVPVRRPGVPLGVLPLYHERSTRPERLAARAEGRSVSQPVSGSRSWS